MIYRSHLEGQHRLHVRLGSEEILGSPFAVKIHPNERISGDEFQHITWDPDTALMAEQKHKTALCGYGAHPQLAVGSAKAAAGFLQMRMRIGEGSRPGTTAPAASDGDGTRGKTITQVRMESEQRYGHLLARKQAVALHSRITSLISAYEPANIDTM